MIVSIHQPNLFPWLGFFDKMACSDVFVLLDTVPFTKGGFQNRVQLKGSNGAQYLTVPVITKGRLGQLTHDVAINNLNQWKKDHPNTFMCLYRGTPGYDQLMSKLEQLYVPSYDKLVDFTIPGILLLKQELDIATGIIRASDLGITGNGSQLLCDLVCAVGGKVYISGPSGKAYLDEKAFEHRGIRVQYHQFQVFGYPQRFGDFGGGLSALDYLFNQPDLSLWRKRETYLHQADGDPARNRRGGANPC